MSTHIHSCSDRHEDRQRCVDVQDLAHKLAKVVMWEAANMGVPGTAVLAEVRSAEDHNSGATLLHVSRPATTLHSSTRVTFDSGQLTCI